MRRKNDKGEDLIPLILFLGLPIYLLMEHPVVFWVLAILIIAVLVLLVALPSHKKKQRSRKNSGDSFLSTLAGLGEELSSNKKHKHSGKCDGDCENCPPHYGYRYGRWYYGHNHMEGCEFGGNSGSGGAVQESKNCRK